METIREYLNNLFMSLPETSEVLRAKAELLGMMEDKYEELIREGKTEKEAVGIVISEFGNLEELAEELGLKVYMGKENEDKTTEPRGQKETKRKGDRTLYKMGVEEIKNYVEYAWKHAGYIAIAVLLCIWAPFPDCILDGAAAEGYLPEILSECIGTLALFGMVAVAVVLFVSAAGMKKRYRNMARCCVSLDEKAGDFLAQKQESDERRRLKMRIGGILLCILSVVPSSVNYAVNSLVSEFMDDSVLLIAGVGVLLLVLSGSVGSRYEEMEKAIRNAAGQVGRSSSPEMKWNEVKKKKMPAAAVIGFVLLGILVVGLNLVLGIWFYMNMNQNGSSQMQESWEQTMSLEKVEKLSVNLDAVNVRVEQGDAENTEENQLVVQGIGAAGKMAEVKQDGNQVVVKEKGERGWFSFDFNFIFMQSKRREIVIIVPKSRTDLVYDLDVDMGKIQINGENFGGEYHQLAQEVDEENAKSGKIKLSADMGDIELEIPFAKDDKDL